MSPNIIKKLKLLRKKSNHHSQKMGAIITKKGIPIGWGWNSLKTHPKSLHLFRSCHAEFKAVRSVKNKELLKGATIIIYREDASGAMVCAKPCKSCQTLLNRSGIARVIYSDNGCFIVQNNV